MRTIRLKLKALGDPMPNVYVRALREAYDSFVASEDLQALLDTVASVETSTAGEARSSSAAIQREDLQLVCYDYVWS